jgi:hypothetical protein
VSAPCTSGTSYDAGGYLGWGDSNKCSDCQQPLALVALGQFLARPANMRRSRLEVEQGSNRKGGSSRYTLRVFSPAIQCNDPHFFFAEVLVHKGFESSIPSQSWGNVGCERACVLDQRVVQVGFSVARRAIDDLERHQCTGS